MSKESFNYTDDVWGDIAIALSVTLQIKPIHLLFFAIRYDNLAFITLCSKELLNERLVGYSPLHLAAYLGRVDIVNALIKAGVDINAFDTNNTFRTAVVLAAENNHSTVVDILLFHKALNPFDDPNEDMMRYCFFKNTERLNLLSLMQKKQYEFNPHRHVKIWLSSDSNIFMNDYNKLRLKKMRVDCLDDEINLVYDSRLLSAKAVSLLYHFCGEETITPIDVRHVITQCTEACELQLIELYEDEVSHLNEGGNLAAASDILRWLKPIFSLGVYSDLDVLVCTKELPKIIPVFGELLCTLSNVMEEEIDKVNISQKTYNNNLMALLNPESEKIKQAQQFIIDACAPATKVPVYMVSFIRQLQKVCQDNDPYFTQLSALFLNVSPRQWRANINHFMDCLEEWHGELIAKEEANILTQLVGSYVNNRAIHSETFYMQSVIKSTGPETVLNWFKKASVHTFSTCAISFYPQLFKAFCASDSKDSRIFSRLNMSQSEFNNQSSGDLSWVPEQYGGPNKLEKALTKSTLAAMKKHAISEQDHVEDEPNNKLNANH